MRGHRSINLIAALFVQLCTIAQWRIKKSAKGKDNSQESAIIQPEGALKHWIPLGK